MRATMTLKRTNGTIIAVALLLAIVATFAIYSYLDGVETGSTGTAAGTVTALVAKEDIPSGTDLDELISSGGFETITVPEDALVPGAITDLSALKGQETREAILEGEQIPEARVTGAVPGGSLGIPDGQTAMSLQLDSPRAVGGAIRAGDSVTVYGTFGQGEGTTIAIVPEALVLQTTSADETAGGVITLALSPQDAQETVFAQERGSIWLVLLPPGQKAPKQGPLTLGKVSR